MSFAVCTSKADLVFLVDSSSSVGEPNFQRILRFLSNLAQEVPLESGHFRFGIVTFSAQARIQVPLGRYTSSEDLVEAIMEIPFTYGVGETVEGLKVLVLLVMIGLQHG